jgi:hypothetical protein
MPDISDFGLVTQKVTGYNDLPALKRILRERDFSTGSITKTEQIITIKMFGRYDSAALLESNVNAFKAALQSDVEQVYFSTSRGITFTAVANRGFKATVFRNDVTILLELSVVV